MHPKPNKQGKLLLKLEFVSISNAVKEYLEVDKK